MRRATLRFAFVFAEIWFGLLCFDGATSSAQDTAAKEPATKTAPAKDVKMKEVFVDKFAGKLAEGWTWFHEDAAGWKVDGEGLHLRTTLPGTIWSKNQFNQLERVAPECPEGKAQAVEVTVNQSPKTEYEQAGLQVIIDDQNIATLCAELYKGKFSAVSGRRIEGKFSHGGDAPIEAGSVTLRITKKDKTVKLEYKSGDEWKTLNEYPYPAPGALKVGIHAHGGKKEDERWARFSNFRILQEE